MERTGDRSHRERRAASRVAVELGQDDAGERQSVGERPRGVHGILALHRIDDEERFHRFERRMQLADLAHHRFVDRQPAGRVDDEHVVVVLARPIKRIDRDRNRLSIRRRGEIIDVDLTRQRFELLHRRRPIHVAAREQHFLARILLETPRDFRRGRRLARALQSGEQDHGRRRSREIERNRGAAHERGELSMHDADERLARRQRGQDVLTERFLAYLVGELPHHRQRDVGFEQRETNLAQSALDVVLGEPRFAAQRLYYAAEPLGQVVEHRATVDLGASREGRVNVGVNSIPTMILLYLLVPAAYLIAALLEWGRLSPGKDASPERSVQTARWVAAFALAGHAALVDAAIVTPTGFDVSFANTLSAVAGLTALFAWLGTLARALPGILAVV